MSDPQRETSTRVEELVNDFATAEDTEQPAVAEQLETLVEGLDAIEQARLLHKLDADDQQTLIEALPNDVAADVIENLSDPQAASVIARLDPELAADVCEQMRSEERADLLGDLRVAQAEAVLAAMEPGPAEDARALIEYADDVAGGLMATEFLAVAETATVGEVLDHLTDGADRFRDYDVQYVYVTSAAKQATAGQTTDALGRLVGVLPLRNLVLTKRAMPVAAVMIADPLSLLDTTSLQDLDTFFEDHRFFGVPVTDADGRLLGVVRRSAVEEAIAERADATYRRSQGLVAEELRSMPVGLRSRRRLAWLSINIVLNAIAASVIIAFESTLQQVIALAVFLPIISDMSGCSGSQAVAVTMRELALGLARPEDVWQVLFKELVVGLINGICLGLLIALGGLAMYGNGWLGLVVGMALALNTVVAVCIGGTVPLLMKRFRFDPAIASGPLLTTVTDMCGFFLVLGLATMFLPKLVGE